MVDRFFDWAKDRCTLSLWRLWKDDRNGITGHLNDDIALGIQKSQLVVAFVSDQYFESRNCHKELNYADTLAKDILIVKLQKDVELAGRGAISLISSTHLYVRNLLWTNLNLC